MIWECIRKDRPTSLDDVGFEYKDGRKGFLGLTIIPMKEGSEEQEGFVLFGADITEKKKAQLEKAKLEEHVWAVQKMESIGTLAGGIAHDFKNILGPILGYAEMMSRSFPPSSKEYERAVKILKSAGRARDLVEQILIFSRKGSDERTPVHVPSVVREALSLLKEVLPSTIEIVADIDRNVSNIVANPTQVHQVIMNLCINAGYAMGPNGGRLTVRAKNVTVTKEFEKLHAGLEPGSYVKLTVEDTGSGIDPKILPRIFDPFFTTKPIGEGSGMGLAVVHGIVTGHGGSIEADSAPNQGTRFDVYFPVTSRGIDAKSADASDIPMGSGRILVVDDDVNQADVIGDMLESLGYQVEKKTSSVEALELVRSQPNLFDAVLLDQIMPKMTGGRVAGELMKIRPNLPVVLCSGNRAAILTEAKSAGIKKCIEKPVSFNILARTIREVLKQP